MVFQHFQDYLTLAYETGHAEVGARQEFFGEMEKNLILAPDELFRFHSGMPQASTLG